jgi:hypothetical protein
MFQHDADNPLIDDGVWRDFKGSRFLIAHTSSDKFQRALSRYQQPHRKAIDEKRLDPVIGKEILCHAMADALLLDWQNVVDRTGQKSKYTPALGYAALKRSPAFRDFVSDVGQELSNFVESEVEDVGNAFASGQPGTVNGESS